MVTSGFHPPVTSYIFSKSSTAKKHDFYFFQELGELFIRQWGLYTVIKFVTKMNGEQPTAIQEKVTGMLLVALEHVMHASVTLA